MGKEKLGMSWWIILVGELLILIMLAANFYFMNGIQDNLNKAHNSFNHIIEITNDSNAKFGKLVKEIQGKIDTKNLIKSKELELIDKLKGLNLPGWKPGWEPGQKLRKGTGKVGLKTIGASDMLLEWMILTRDEYSREDLEGKKGFLLALQKDVDGINNGKMRTMMSSWIATETVKLR